MSNNYIEEIGRKAKASAPFLAACGTDIKNRALEEIARALEKNKGVVLEANSKDVENAKKNGLSESMTERLTLNEKRISGMIEGIGQVMALPDPVGEVLGGRTLPNGLSIVKKRVPMGVIGIIFESRPNVTVDAAALCFKAGSAVILRGGSDAINSNKALVGIMRGAVKAAGAPEDLSLIHI